MQFRRNNNPFFKWLSENGFWVGKATTNSTTNATTTATKKRPLCSSSSSYTHVFLDGGKAVVPSHTITSACDKYAEAVVSGYPQYAVECAPRDRMRMFVDIDTKHLPSIPSTFPSSEPPGPSEASGTPDASGTSEESGKRTAALNTDTPGGDAAAKATKATKASEEMFAREVQVLELVLDSAESRFGDILSDGAVVCFKRSGDGRRLGGGIHIVWKGDKAIVSDREASVIRNGIVEGCVLRSQKKGMVAADDDKVDDKKWWKEIPWDDIIDKAVYKTASLRMIFSRKRSFLPKKGKGKCEGKCEGEVDASIYVPAFLFSPPSHSSEKERVMTPSTTPSSTIHRHERLHTIAQDDVLRDMASWVRICSIHPPALPLLLTRSLSYGDGDEDDNVNGENNGQGQKTNGKRRRPNLLSSIDDGTTTDERRGGLSRSLLESTDIDPQKLEEFRASLPEPYRSSCMLTAIRKNEDSGTYVINTNSRFCLNKEDEHASNHVYFVAKKEGVFQRCFDDSTSSEERKFGPCCHLDLKICDSHPFPPLQKRTAKQRRSLIIDKKISSVPTPSSVADAWLDKILTGGKGNK